MKKGWDPRRHQQEAFQRRVGSILADHPERHCPSDGHHAGQPEQTRSTREKREVVQPARAAIVRPIFANMKCHVNEHEIRGWWLRACDVLPPQLGRSAGSARNIRRYQVQDTAELNKTVHDDTPVVMSVWRVNGVFPTVRQHDFFVCEHEFVCVQLPHDFDTEERTTELGWTWPVAGLGDPAPVFHADVPYAYKVVHSKRDEVRRLYVHVCKHEFYIQEQGFVFTSRTQPR